MAPPPMKLKIKLGSSKRVHESPDSHSTAATSDQPSTSGKSDQTATPGMPKQKLKITLRSSKRVCKSPDTTRDLVLSDQSTQSGTANQKTTPGMPLRKLNTKLRSTKRVHKFPDSLLSAEPFTAGTSDQPSSKQPSTSHRQRLKKSQPAAYKLFLLDDAERQQERRKNWPKERRNRETEASRHRMAKKRKLEKEANEAAAKDNPPNKPKRQTRSEKETENKEKAVKRKYNREYQQMRRAKFSLAQVDEINAKRRNKRMQEKEELLEYRRLHAKQREDEKERLRRKEEMEQNEREQMEMLVNEEYEIDLAIEQESNQSERSKAAQRKSLERARAAMPNDAEAYVDTYEDLRTKVTPKKKFAFARREQNGIAVSSRLDKLVAIGLKPQLAKLKGKHQKKMLAARRELVSVLSITKKYNLQRSACREFGLSNKKIKSTQEPFKYRNAVALQPYTKTVVKKYYELHSIELPDTKAVSKKTLLKTRILEKTIRALYDSFSKEFPEHKIGASSFFNLRPAHIRRVTDIRFRGCLCEYCENVNLKVKAISSICQSQQKPQCKIKDITEATEIIMCPRVGKHHAKSCIERVCNKCSANAIDQHLNDLDLTQMCTWNRWETSKQEIMTKTGSKEIARKVRLVKNGTVNDMVAELKEELEPLCLHLFIKNWQQHQFTKLTSKKLPDNYCVMVLDFAENYTCKAQDEVQAAHWTQEQITLHPIICYYDCHKSSCETPITHSLAFISNDLTHDHHAVQTFTTQAVQFVKNITSKPLTKIVRFSDGCGVQYKSKGPFMDVSYAIQDHDLPIQHEYFGSRHGKGPSDGESAVIKRKTSMAEASHQAPITNAYEMYTYCKAELTKNETDPVEQCTHFKRSMFYVPREDIDRKRLRDGKTLPGTRRLHSVTTVKPGVVASRNISCFCLACLKGFGICDNTEYVEPWKEVRIGKAVNMVKEKKSTQATSPTNKDGNDEADDGTYDSDDDSDKAAEDGSDDDGSHDAAKDGSDDDSNDDGSHDDRSDDAAKDGTDDDGAAEKTRVEDYQVGQYVAVIYDNQWYAGEVLEVTVTNATSTL